MTNNNRNGKYTVTARRGMTRRQRRFVGQSILLLIGIAGFFMILNSIGTLDGDYFTINIQLSLNVRYCVVGFALITGATNLYRALFRD